MNAGGFVLPVILALPLLGAIFVMLTPRGEGSIARGVGLVVSSVTFLMSLLVLRYFDDKEAGYQLVTDAVWVSSLGIHMKLGIDGISLWLVLLTTFLTPLTLLAATKSIEKHVREFVAAFLVLETGMLGAFVSLDLFVFYVFWEVMLIPMYLMIGIWGGQRRLYASIKFVIYTMVGSLLMLVAIFYLYVQHGAGHRHLHHRAPPHHRRAASTLGLARWSAARGAGVVLRWRSRWRSRSRCRCSRCTPGCPTPTSRRRPRAR
jgi:NADH-quinone oxidoreductase subunit M